MNSIDDTPGGSDRMALAFVDRLAALGEQAHRERSADVRLLADTAVGLGRTWGWREGSRRATRVATTTAATAARRVANPREFALIFEKVRDVWHTAGPSPLPRSVGVPRVDLTDRGPGIVAVLGTIAYHQAWHAAHRAAADMVVRAVEDVLGAERRGPRWPLIRVEIIDAVHADRDIGPFAHSPVGRDAFVPPQHWDRGVIGQDTVKVPAPAHGPMLAGQRGRSR